MFGGAYVWTEIPILAAAVALAALVRPRIAARGTRTVDLALCACLAIVALQLLPVPQPVRLTLAPASARVDQTLYLPDASPSNRARAPLTIDPGATAMSGALAAAIVLLFWCARAAFDHAAERRVIRLIAGAGLIASATAVVQHATAPTLLYWTWRPIDPTARPYSPFVNRNDFAAWLVMAIPLTAGYLVARIESRRGPAGSGAVNEMVDATTVWLAGSVCVMAGTLIALLSRSGLIAGVSGLVTFGLLARQRAASRARGVLLLGLGLLAAAAIAFFNSEALSPRLADALSNGLGSRRDIWSWTLVMFRDFWRVGVGVGAYARAMSAYQPPHDFAFNHAHDAYLQVAVEGGVGMAACAAIAIATAVAEAARWVRRDRTPLYWVRAGAVGGIAATAIQSIWESALRMPANAVLFAVCAAIVLRPPALARP